MRSILLPLVGIALPFLLLAEATAAESQYDVQYYNLPSGDHPHDVAPAPDGTVWYTGQHKGVLGRLDPKTGTVTVFRSATARARMASSSVLTAMPGSLMGGSTPSSVSMPRRSG